MVKQMAELTQTKFMFRQTEPTQVHCLNLGYQNFNALSVSRCSFYSEKADLGMLYVRVGTYANHSVSTATDGNWRRYTQAIPLTGAGYSVFTQNMNRDVQADWNGPIVVGDSLHCVEITLSVHDAAGDLVPAPLDKPCWIELHFILAADRPMP
jgi:hypothetical protein